MAKKNKILPPSYYAFYNEKTGDILSITNEKHPIHSTGIEITYEEFERFVSGSEKFNDYSVGYIRTPDNKRVLSIIPKSDQGYSFKNNVFEWITEKPVKNTELIITWDNKRKAWYIEISKSCKKRLASEITPNKFIFFVMLKDDFDFLIRTITIETIDLINNKIEIDFNSKFEEDISKISIATKLFFESYGLKINE